MAKFVEENNLSMFDICELSETPSSKIDVVKLGYISSESVTWQELFDGYSELYAITFSSGINFVYALLDMFKRAEVIFGNEAVMSYSMQEIMAYQSLVISRMRDEAGEKRQKLLNRIDDESVRFYVARKQLSHEKIYLLKSDDGKKRVIMGSANMSYNAFGGFQRENICYIDGDEAFDWYMNCFKELKEESTDQITKKAFVSADLSENIDDLPISESVKTQKAVLIESSNEVSDEVQFILDTQNLAKRIASFTPKPDKKTGKTICTDPVKTDNRKKLPPMVE